MQNFRLSKTVLAAGCALGLLAGCATTPAGERGSAAASGGYPLATTEPEGMPASRPAA
jgi:hypothetical protein